MKTQDRIDHVAVRELQLWAMNTEHLYKQVISPAQAIEEVTANVIRDYDRNFGYTPDYATERNLAKQLRAERKEYEASK
jgi:hypothetical protein